VRGDGLVVGVYVDDLMITGSNSEKIQKFKLQMAKTFRMSVHHDRLKYIDVRFYLIREYANRGQIEVDFIRIEE
jgi:hypothetical protein